MLKCFFVMRIVVPCEAEGPDKALSCVCHAVCREAKPAPPARAREAQPKALSGPHYRLATKEPRHWGWTGWVILHGFTLHITEHMGLLPLSHHTGILHLQVSPER